MSSGCGDILSLQDLQTAKKHQLFEAEVITGKQGGTAAGANIDYATNQVTGQTQKTLPATLRDAGFTPASFTFTTGGTLAATDANKAVYDPVSLTWYIWGGTLPKVIPAATNPLLDQLWKPWTDPNLRTDMANTVDPLKGDALLGVKLPYANASSLTQHAFNNNQIFNVKSWGATGDGTTNDTTAIRNCFANLKAIFLTGCEVHFPVGRYGVSGTITVPDRINISGEGLGTEIFALSGFSGSSVLEFDTGPQTSGAFLRDLTITGNSGISGVGTVIRTTDTSIKQLYALNISRVTVQTCSIGFDMQGWWHSSLTDCRTAGCNTGLRLLGQCVSIHISGCKFSVEGTAATNSVGIRIQPQTYTWSSGAIQSEAIIIDGETMMIGNTVGLWLHAGLDIQVSNVDIDFVGATGIIVEGHSSTLNIRDSWIAAKADATAQFIGIDLRAQTPAVLRNISGMEIQCNNANPLNNNIGISLAASSAVNIDSCNIIGGQFSVFGVNSRNVNINNNTFAKTVSLNGVDGLQMAGNYLTGFSLINSPVGSDLTIGVNNNTITKKLVAVTVPAGATAATYNIPSPISGVVYGVRKVERDVAASKDTVSISGSVISVARPSAVGLAIPCMVEYFILGN